MKKKKMLVLCMATCMVVSSILSGCGSASDNTGSTGSAPSVVEGENGNVSDVAEREDITITMMMAESSTQEMPDTTAVVEAVKEKFNINLELMIIPGSDYTTKKSTTLASNSMPDIVSGMTVDEVKQYGASGMFLSLDDYKDYAPDYYALIESDDRAIETNKIKVNDTLYCFQKLEKYRVALSSILAIRMDLLEELNIETPTTFDEYYQALLEIKKAYPDMYGFSSRNGTNYLLGQFAYAMGTGGFPLFNTTRGMYLEPGSDSYIYGPSDEKFVKVVEFMRQAYADGILDPDYATMDKDTMFEKLSSGKLMSVYDNNFFVGRTYNPALSQVDENAYFDVLEPLADEDGNVRSYRYNKDWTDNVAVISSQTKYPERIVEMMNWLYTDEGVMISNFGVEGVDYDIVDGEPVIKQSLLDECEGASDIFSAVSGKLGAGLQGLGFYIDESLYKQTSDAIFLEQSEKITTWTEEGKITYLPGWPPFTEEEQEKVTEIEQKLTNVFNQEIDSFITGKKSMDEWNNLVETLKSQGSEELESIFNAAYERIK